MALDALEQLLLTLPFHPQSLPPSLLTFFAILIFKIRLQWQA